MPAKPAAAAPAAAAPAEAPAPPDPGPNIDPNIPRVKEVCSLFDPERTGFLPTSDAVTALHALGVFVTQEEFDATVLPKLDSAGEPAPRVATSKLEAAALALLASRAHPAPNGLELQAAFRALDKEGSGAVTVDSLRRTLTNPATPGAFSVAQFDAFISKLVKVPVPDGDREKVSYELYARGLQ
jgi:Ca2+-binding EF-hand superfamily protein